MARLKRIYFVIAILTVIVVASLLPRTPSEIPSPSPTGISRAAAPTVTPYIIPDQCAYTNATYQLRRVATMNPGFDNEVPSPGGLYIVYQRSEGIFVRDRSESQVYQLADSPVYDLPRWVRWSRSGQRLALIQGTYEAGMDATVFDFGNGLMQPERIMLHTKLNDPYEFFGWSPTDRHFVVTNQTLDDPRLNIWSVDQQQITYSTAIIEVLVVSWSPDGTLLAYAWGKLFENGQPIDTNPTIPPGEQDIPPEDDPFTLGYGITIVAADGSRKSSWTISNDVSLYDVSPKFIWSPDSRAVALFDTAAGSLRVYNVDGRQSGNLSSGIYVYQQKPDDYFYKLAVAWTTNSQWLTFWSQPDSSQYRLMRWTPHQPEPEFIFSTMRPPFFPPTDQLSPDTLRMAIYREASGRYGIDLMNVDGTNPVSFLKDVADAGNPDWSPDGQRVAAAWAAVENGKREVRVSWANAYGNDYGELDQDWIDARNFNWPLDGRVLTFVGVLDSGFTIEMVNVESGSYRRMMDSLQAVIYPRFADQGEFYTVRWQSLDGTSGYDAYTADGQRVYRVPVDGDVSRSSELFWSPDHQFAAVKIRGLDSESLQLTDTGSGESRIVRSGLSGLGDPLWSPDSRMVAFTQSIDKGPVTLHIVDTDGQELWSSTGAAWIPIEWVRCS